MSDPTSVPELDERGIAIRTQAVAANSLPGHDRECAAAMLSQARLRTNPIDEIQVAHLLEIGWRAGKAAAVEPAPPTEIGIESPDCIQVIMAPSEQQLYRRWLAARDLHLYSIPGLNPDDLPTFAIGIGADHA